MQGRDHKCNYCDKTYLSYPALYTHMKNKHAKGPDGQPLININSGRGRGRPKKNANAGLRFSHVDPSSDNFFKSNVERAGGPVEPTFGFREVYTEIYIKRPKQPVQPLSQANNEDGEENDAEQDDKKANEALEGADDEEAKEKVKKKRGRKPKSFYIEQQKEQERLAKEQAELRKSEMQEAENEEEVVSRHEEYKHHPLFARLKLYTEELKDYIDERRRLDAEIIHEPPKLLGDGNIFCTKKILGNMRPEDSEPNKGLDGGEQSDEEGNRMITEDL